MMDQKKLRVWTLFTQGILSHTHFVNFVGNLYSSKFSKQYTSGFITLFFKEWYTWLSRPPIPLVYLREKLFHPLTLNVQFQTTSPPFQMITNKLKENLIQGWLLYVTRSFLQPGFRFQYQLINLVWLSFYFFSFSWSGFILLWVHLSKNITKLCFVYNYSHF